jgi:hypothetical protein
MEHRLESIHLGRKMSWVVRSGQSGRNVNIIRSSGTNAVAIPWITLTLLVLVPHRENIICSKPHGSIFNKRRLISINHISASGSINHHFFMFSYCFGVGPQSISQVSQF